MSGYNIINEFNDYLCDNRVRQLTVKYQQASGAWSERAGEILRHPEFGGSAIGTSIRFRLHTDPESPHGYFSDLWFMCWHAEHMSFELSEEGAIGILHGFERIGNDEYDVPCGVDIVVHARTR